MPLCSDLSLVVNAKALSFLPTTYVVCGKIMSSWASVILFIQGGGCQVCSRAGGERVGECGLRCRGEGGKVPDSGWGGGGWCRSGGQVVRGPGGQ